MPRQYGSVVKKDASMSVTMKAMPLVASMLGNKLGVKVVIGSSDTAYTNGDTIFLPPLPVDDEGVLYPERFY